MKSNIMPVYLRELRSLFYSPIAYLVLFAFFFLSAYFWGSSVGLYADYSVRMARRGADLKLMEYLFSPYLGNVVVTFIFLLPLISMRGFAEEKRQGTIETLFTLPLSDLDILLGKYFAQLTLLAIMLLPVALFPFSLADKVSIHWPTLVVGFAGVYLTGAMFLAAGLFTSALTENQVIAAALGFGATLFFFLLGWVESMVPGPLKSIVNQVSVMGHLQELTRGLVQVKDLSYFLLAIFAALFCTLRVLESKKWR